MDFRLHNFTVEWVEKLKSHRWKDTEYNFIIFISYKTSMLETARKVEKKEKLIRKQEKFHIQKYLKPQTRIKL